MQKICVLYAKNYNGSKKEPHRRLCGWDKYQLCILQWNRNINRNTNIHRLHLFTILQGNCVGGGAKDWHHFHIVWHNSKIHTLKKLSWQFLFQTPTRLSIWRTCSRTSTKLSWCWNMLRVDAYFSSLSLSNTHQQH